MGGISAAWRSGEARGGGGERGRERRMKTARVMMIAASVVGEPIERGPRRSLR
jgi:hypothetical protein